MTRSTFFRGWFHLSRGTAAGEPPGGGKEDEDDVWPWPCSLLRVVCGDPPGAKVARGRDVVDSPGDILLLLLCAGECCCCLWRAEREAGGSWSSTHVGSVVTVVELVDIVCAVMRALGEGRWGKVNKCGLTSLYLLAVAQL